MTIPTIRIYACIIMTLVTKFLFVGMASQTRILKADPHLFTLFVYVPPVSVPQGLISPIIQKLHVGRDHELSILDALFLW